MISLKADPEGHAPCGDTNPLLPVSTMDMSIIVSQKEITSQ